MRKNSENTRNCSKTLANLNKNGYNLEGMDKIIAFDIGDKRVGVACSDPLGIMALPSKTYWRKGFEVDLKRLAEIAVEHGATKIVCGLPLNFDGSESQQTVKTREFIEGLKKYTDLPIETADERFSTLQARRLLIEADMRREKRKDVIDSVAASYILEDYLRKNK